MEPDESAPSETPDARPDVAANARVARYRIGFRTPDGAVILHHDRRLPSDDRRPNLVGPAALARATW